MNSWKAILTLGLAVLGITGAAGYGEDKTFRQHTQHASGEYRWEENNNWLNSMSQTGQPTAADRAIIPTGLVCDVSSATAVADQLRVEGTGDLNINASSKLTLDEGTSPACELVASGSEVILQGSAAELAFITDSAQSVSGSGKFVGQHAAAKVSIGSGVTLTNSAIIEGTLLIDGAGSFTNNGRVEANNVDDALVVQVTGTVDDSAGINRWIASAGGVTLQFASAIGTLASMEGECVVSAGKLLVSARASGTFTTTHRLKISGGTFEAAETTTMGNATNSLDMTGGKVLVAAGETFTHD